MKTSSSKINHLRSDKLKTASMSIDRIFSMGWCSVGQWFGEQIKPWYTSIEYTVAENGTTVEIEANNGCLKIPNQIQIDRSDTHDSASTCESANLSKESLDLPAHAAKAGSNAGTSAAVPMKSSATRVAYVVCLVSLTMYRSRSGYSYTMIAGFGDRLLDKCIDCQSDSELRLYDRSASRRWYP